MDSHSNVTLAMNGSVQKLLNLINEIINRHTPAYAQDVKKGGHVLHVVNRNINTILLNVSGSMQEQIMNEENAKIVVNAQRLVYGLVKDVIQENPKLNFPNGYREMAKTNDKQQDVTRAEMNRRQKANAYVRQTKPW